MRHYEMATFFLVAEEPVANKQQQDCRLIVHVTATAEGGDNQVLQQEAEAAMKKRFPAASTFDLISEQAATAYSQGDPAPTTGSMNLETGQLAWTLARINYK
jgi:hypothetical protein